MRRQRVSVLVASILGLWKHVHVRPLSGMHLDSIVGCLNLRYFRGSTETSAPLRAKRWWADSLHRHILRSTHGNTKQSRGRKNHASRQTTSVYGFKGTDSFLWNIWAPMKNVLWLILLHPPCTPPNQAFLPWGWTALFFTHMGIPQSRPLGNPAAAP